eukprot:1185767-Prorocentrum_minimum.AAC.3
MTNRAESRAKWRNASCGSESQTLNGDSRRPRGLGNGLLVAKQVRSARLHTPPIREPAGRSRCSMQLPLHCQSFLTTPSNPAQVGGVAAVLSANKPANSITHRQGQEWRGANDIYGCSTGNRINASGVTESEQK